MLTIDFTDTTGIDTVSGGYVDARQLVVQTRSKATTLGEFLFTGLSDWVHVGAVEIQTITDDDPAITSTVQLDSRYTLNASTFIQRRVEEIPANFGFCSLIALVQGSQSLADALLYQVQKTVNDKNVMIKFCRLGVFVFLSGDWMQLSSHSNVIFCEWWIEVKELNGQDVIEAYAGTQLVGRLTGNLPNGPATNSGLVYIGQESQLTANNVSRVAYMSLGQTQLCDLLELTTVPYTLPFESSALMLSLWLEDITATFSLEDLEVTLLISGGLSQIVPLRDLGAVGKGVVDSKKYVKLLLSNLSFLLPAGTQIKFKLRVLTQKFIGLHGIAALVSSTM